MRIDNASHIEAQVIDAPNFGGYLVAWFGVIHGGVHFDRADALQHAQALRDAELWDKRGWWDQHIEPWL